MLPLSLTLGLAWLGSLSPVVLAGNVTEGGACDLVHNKLSPDTKQFSSDCSATTYCGSDSTCHRKGCRKDEYPFGYRLYSHTIPDRCGKGKFCPDEEDSCQDLVPVGGLCQLNRDDQCEPPPNFSELAGPNNRNGSVCLNYTCMWANATLGNDCAIENTPYIGYEAGTGTQYINVVSRGNCVTGLFCDAVSRKCLRTLDIGQQCTADKECITDNCTQAGVCGGLPNAAKKFPVAIYVVVALCIFGIMTGTLVSLYILHRRHRGEEREKRAQYWREQEQFRQNIMQMREQARGSLLSLPWQQSQPGSPRNYAGGLDEYQSKEYNSNTPMLHAAAQPSGLRNGFSDNGYDDETKETGSTEDGLVMRPGPRSGGNGTSSAARRPAGGAKRI